MEETPRSARAADDLTPSLVERLRDGDPSAGRLLNDIYREKLVRFCWGYLNRMEEAEDAVQDICCKVLAADTVPDAFRPWVYKTARNHCLNLLRSRSRRKDAAALPSASQVHEVLTGHLTKLVQEERRSKLSELVQQLPETQREVLRLRYVEGLSRSDIASVLGISESVAKSRLFESMKWLRNKAAQLGSD